MEVYPYEGSDETGCPDSSFGQTISSKITIPIIPGPAPPSYPGDKPLLTDFMDSNSSEDQSRKEFDRALSEWTKSAKLFVEFYSILFLPWDAKMDPRDPTMPTLKILPWDDETSWENFKTIFRSWDVDTNNTNDTRSWFKRTTYKIFQNMVENMRQSSLARKLMLAWRALVADKRKPSTKVNQTNSVNDGSPAEEINIDDDGDDIKFLMDFLRTKHGNQGEATSNALKKEQYLNDLVANMNDIYDTHELNINDPEPPISQNTLETSSEQYLDFSITQCKNMLKNIKGTNIFDEMTVDEDDFM